MKTKILHLIFSALISWTFLVNSSNAFDLKNDAIENNEDKKYEEFDWTSKENVHILATMENNLYVYTLSEALRDFLQKIEYGIMVDGLPYNLDSVEYDLADMILGNFNLKRLEAKRRLYVGLMRRDPHIKEIPYLKHHLIAHFKEAYLYLGRNFAQFKKIVTAVQNKEEYSKTILDVITNQKDTLMPLLFYWFDCMKYYPHQFDELKAKNTFFQWVDEVRVNWTTTGHNLYTQKATSQNTTSSGEESNVRGGDFGFKNPKEQVRRMRRSVSNDIPSSVIITKIIKRSTEYAEDSNQNTTQLEHLSAKPEKVEANQTVQKYLTSATTKNNISPKSDLTLDAKSNETKFEKNVLHKKYTPKKTLLVQDENKKWRQYVAKVSKNGKAIHLIPVITKQSDLTLEALEEFNFQSDKESKGNKHSVKREDVTFRPSKDRKQNSKQTVLTEGQEKIDNFRATRNKRSVMDHYPYGNGRSYSGLPGQQEPSSGLSGLSGPVPIELPPGYFVSFEKLKRELENTFNTQTSNVSTELQDAVSGLLGNREQNKQQIMNNPAQNFQRPPHRFATNSPSRPPPMGYYPGNQADRRRDLPTTVPYNRRMAPQMQQSQNYRPSMMQGQQRPNPQRYQPRNPEVPNDNYDSIHLRRYTQRKPIPEDEYYMQRRQ